MQSAPCPYCRRVPCDPNRRYRVHADCQPVNRIESVKWFVLPPAIEWYYRKKHSNYRPLPPYREDCLALLSGFDTASMSLIYPDNDSAVYIPRNLDGRRGRLVFEAAHRSAGAVVYWHLDSEYLGLTRNLHQMSLAPEPGRHVITLVDDNGEQVKRVFTVLSPGENQ